MQTRNVAAFKSASTQEWTLERLARLSKQEVEQLQENAQRLGAASVVDLCTEALKKRPTAKQAAALNPAKTQRRLASRVKALGARGVRLHDTTSWGGVRKDGKVVLALWASAVHSSDGGCSYLLWAPNVDASRPWSDTAAGKERLEHCKLALEKEAEGVLVYGERMVGELPEQKARSIHGVDMDVVLLFTVEKRGEEYWATWGKAATKD
jgi:hypothetical protein